MISKTTTLFAAIALVASISPFANSAGLGLQPDVAPVKKETNAAQTMLELLSRLGQKSLDTPAKNTPLKEHPIKPYSHFGKSLTLDLAEGPTHEVTHDWASDCGQYVAATLLMDIGYTIDKAAYDAIGRELNPEQRGTSAATLDTYLNRFFRCTTHRNAEQKLLFEHLNKGFPVIAIVEPRPNTLHWVIVRGYQQNRAGKGLIFYLRDNGTSPRVMSGNIFMNQWECRDSGPEVKNACLLIYPKKGKIATSKPAPITAEPGHSEPYRNATDLDFGPSFLSSFVSRLPRRRDK